MAEFMVETNAVKTAAAAQERLRRELEDVRKTVRGISGSLVLQTAASAGIRRRLGSLAGHIEGQRNSMGSMKDALERVAALYEEAERNICGYPEGGTKPAQEKKGSSLWDGIAKWLKGAIGTVGAIVGGLLAPVTTIWREGFFGNWGTTQEVIGKGIPTNKPPIGGWVGGPLTTAPQLPPGGILGGNRAPIGWLGAPRYKQPEYTQKDLAPGANGIYGPYVYRRDGSPCRMYEWNDDAQKQLSCTYYTLRKLNEQGLSYPCVSGPAGNGPGNGGQWYANFDRDSGLHSYAGNNALDDLANNLTLPQANVVVSFDKGQWGHVLLIDEIYKDANGTVRVKYSDMYYIEPGGRTRYIDSLNGNNPQLDMPLAEFKANYNKYNGNMSGAVVIGAGDRPRKLD